MSFMPPAVDGRGAADRLPLLLTPGPLTTAPEVRAAASRDWGSRESDFIELTARVRKRLVALAGGEELVAVPIQGSGTFAVEAMLGTMVPPSGCVLILVNGSYGRRMVQICRRIGRSHQVLECAEDSIPSVAVLERHLMSEPRITHVAVVEVETTSGILNPIAEIAQAVFRNGRRLLIDAMSAFGALTPTHDLIPYDALAASSSKCLEALPGLAFVMAKKDALLEASGSAPSLSLDLHDQWRGLEANGQWRFTPPTQIVAAFDRALDLLEQEGGVRARLKRYRSNLQVLRQGMDQLGFHAFLPEHLNAPIIATYHPLNDRFDFEAFHRKLFALGFAIYPGKLTREPSFRVGCIGQVFPSDMERFIDAVATILNLHRRQAIPG